MAQRLYRSAASRQILTIYRIARRGITNGTATRFFVPHSDELWSEGDRRLHDSRGGVSDPMTLFMGGPGGDSEADPVSSTTERKTIIRR